MIKKLNKTEYIKQLELKIKSLERDRKFNDNIIMRLDNQINIFVRTIAELEEQILKLKLKELIN